MGKDDRSQDIINIIFEDHILSPEDFLAFQDGSGTVQLALNKGLLPNLKIGQLFKFYGTVFRLSRFVPYEEYIERAARQYFQPAYNFPRAVANNYHLIELIGD